MKFKKKNHYKRTAKTVDKIIHQNGKGHRTFFQNSGARLNIFIIWVRTNRKRQEHGALKCHFAEIFGGSRHTTTITIIKINKLRA